MGRITRLVEVYHLKEGKYSSTPDLVLDDDLLATSQSTIQSTADTFQIRLRNFQETVGALKGSYQFKTDGRRRTGSFEIDDRVLIYITTLKGRIIDAADKSLYLRFDGLVTDVSYTSGPDGRVFVVTGANRLEKLLTYTFPGLYYTRNGKSWSASQAIQDIIDRVNAVMQKGLSGNSLNPIIWDSTNDTSDTTEITYVRNYKPAFQMIEELSTQRVNGDWNAIYYLDEDNKFHWKKKSRNVDGLIINERDVASLKITSRIWDVFNALIVSTGPDKYGHNIHVQVLNTASMARYGLRYAPGVRHLNDPWNSLYSAEKRQANFGTGDFPSTYSPSWTMQFKTRNKAGELGTSNVVVKSDAGFNQALRVEARWLLRSAAQHLVDYGGVPTDRANVSLNGRRWENSILTTSTSLPLGMGDLVKVDVPSLNKTGNNAKELRVNSVDHSIDRNGWLVSLELVKDIETSSLGALT